ncbi:MAG TPA: hypothetical protein VFN53_02485 [Acidobacteriaceae bacterium]|nr:hypothetical protein [Acidobacteriaceae bacterium]
MRLGRKLGRGTRLAAEALRSQAQDAVVAARSKTPEVTAQSRVIAQQGRVVTHRVSSGTRGFRRGFWKPFTHAVRALWHEITGLFFGIFALFFAQGLWRVRYAWQSGPEHRHFIVYLIVMILFAYFSVTSFVSSRRTPH